MTTATYHVPESLHADKRKPVIVHAAQLDWIPSPMAGVDRRFLDRKGGEVAQATSIVRYAADSRFASHTHDLGEEYLVLQGVFSDQDGHFEQGAYVRNPPGSSHAPFTREGCVIFVKLRQMNRNETATVHRKIDPANSQPGPVAGMIRQNLFECAGQESVAIETLQEGAVWGNRTACGGEEILVLEGSLRYGEHRCPPWTWLRIPGGAEQSLRAESATRYWVKRGHLPPTSA